MTKYFIIPYRDREAEKAIFINHMSKILEGQDFKLIFVHQKDKRQFNRGAMKNIGFIYVRKANPSAYKKDTFIFHDIDTLPYKKDLFDYETTEGTISHYYGFKFALGGLLAVKGVDFERIYGFPNYWGWGFEDNKLQMKWEEVSGKINRSQFIPIYDPAILQVMTGFPPKFCEKTMNMKNVTYLQDAASNDGGFNTLRNLTYDIETISDNVLMLHVEHFDTEKPENEGIYKTGVPRRAHKNKRIFGLNEIRRAGQMQQRRPVRRPVRRQGRRHSWMSGILGAAQR